MQQITWLIVELNAEFKMIFTNALDLQDMNTKSL
jgi:hypothetical protein